MVIRNLTKNTILADRCRTACSFSARFIGLMNEKRLENGCGLLIVPCNSIHMFFMKFAIDVIFLDKDKNAVHIIEGIRPWRISRIVCNAHSVLELPSGTVKAAMTEAGDKLELVL